MEQDIAVLRDRADVVLLDHYQGAGNALSECELNAIEQQNFSRMLDSEEWVTDALCDLLDEHDPFCKQIFELVQACHAQQAEKVQVIAQAINATVTQFLQKQAREYALERKEV